MALVANKTASNLAFDKTIECRVVSVEKKEFGIYMVESDEAKFEAYATGTNTYYANDIVYVTIPGGDFKRQKFIIGRKTDENDASSVYNLKFPFDDFIKLTQIDLTTVEEAKALAELDYNNTVDNINNKSHIMDFGQAQEALKKAEEDYKAQLEYIDKTYEVQSPVDTGFLANYSQDNNIHIYGVNFIQPIVGMSKLGIELEVQTLLGDFHPINGLYGLQIDVHGIIGPTEEVESYELTESFLFSNKDMYGNSYAYYNPYIQQKVLDISNFKEVHSVNIFFVQDCMFYDEEGKLIPYEKDEIDEVTGEHERGFLPKNIFLTNFKAYFGLAGSELNEEKLYLYTYDPLWFNKDSEEYNEKTLRFQWVHIKDDKSGTILFSKPEDIDTFNNALRKEIFGENNDHPTNEQLIAYENRKLQICWYIEDLDEIASADEIAESLGPLYAGNRWKVITDNETEALDEYGNPKVGYYYDSGFPKGSNSSVFEYSIDFNNFNRDEENPTIYRYARCKYKVAVIFGTNKYFSSELTFKNFASLNGTVEEGHTENADIIFRCFSGRRSEDGKYTIEWDNNSSIGRFYVYDENDNILMDSDGRRFSDITYYMQLWHRDPDYPQNYIPLMYEKYDNSEDAEDGHQITDINFTAKWSFFDNSTMLHSSNTPNLTDEEVQAFVELLGMPSVVKKEVTTENGTELIIDFNDPDIKALREITRSFTIEDHLYSYKKNNEVVAIVDKNHQKYYAHKDFQFGRANSQGTEYTATIVLKKVGNIEGADTQLVHGKRFSLECQIYDKDHKLARFDHEIQYDWQLLNEEQCYIKVDSNNAGAIYSGTWYSFKEDKKTPNAAPAFKVTIKNAGEHEIYAKRGFLAGPEKLNNVPYVAILPERVEYRSDGSYPYYYTNWFTVYEAGTNKQLYTDWIINKDLSTPHSHTTQKDDELIVVHTDIIPDGQIISKPVSAKTVTENNEEDTEISAEHNDYKLKMQEWGSIGYLWDNRFENTVLQLEGNCKGQIIRQAIVFDQNVYPSSLVNTWDGVALSVDEATGSILANRIATGTKDNSGRFTGIMMGDWSAYGDESVDTTGIYGFENGQETFGFLKDGSGFIGAAGAGQIRFDGRTAMIASALKNEFGTPSCYINLNPARVGNPDSVLNSDSQYFLYCETDRAKDAEVGLDQSWVNKFFKKKRKVDADGNYIKDEFDQYVYEENDKDYFIVDPIRGVLTTGGIIARYGYIGDWLIDKGGLSWYSEQSLTEENFYDTIYFGNWTRNPYCIMYRDEYEKEKEDTYKLIEDTYNQKREELTKQYEEDLKKIKMTGTIRDAQELEKQYKKSLDELDKEKKKEQSNALEAFAKDNKYRQYLMSAGRLTKNKFDYDNNGAMNFGVTADGYLFSQSGRIGGWNINATQLYSDGETIVLDGALGSIKIGKMVPDVIDPDIVAMEGSVNIAGYEIIGLAGGASFASGSDLSSNTITVDFGTYEEVTWESSNSAYPTFSTSGIKDTLILYNNNIEYDEFKANYKEQDVLITDADLKEYTVTLSQDNLGTKNLWIYTKFYNKTNNILFSESDRADKDWRVISTNLSSAINEILNDNNTTLAGDVTIAFTTFYLVNNYILNITDNNWHNVIETVALDSSHTTLWRYIAIKLTFQGKKSDGTVLDLEVTINTPGESLLVYDVDKEVVTTTPVAAIDTLSTSSYTLSDSVKYNIASLNEWKVIKDISNNKLGILLSTGLGEKIIKNDDSNTDTIVSPIITFNPVYNDNDPALAFLGTPDREWTIICGNELYMNKNLVATQLWANTDIKVPLLQKIAEVSKAASNAIALGNRALDQAKSSLAQVRDLAKKAVHTITLTQKGGVPSNGIGLKFSAKNKYGATICSFESNNWPSFAHRHDLSISGNSIKVGSATGTAGCDISNATVIQSLNDKVTALETKVSNLATTVSNLNLKPAHTHYSGSYQTAEGIKVSGMSGAASY